MPKPKVKFGEFDEYFWKEIAPREARKNREKWEKNRAHQNHLDRLSERIRWAKKYYSTETSPCALSSTQEHSSYFPKQNSNFKNQNLNFGINELLPQITNHQTPIFPNSPQELNSQVENPQEKSSQKLFTQEPSISKLSISNFSLLFCPTTQKSKLLGFNFKNAPFKETKSLGFSKNPLSLSFSSPFSFPATPSSPSSPVTIPLGEKPPVITSPTSQNPYSPHPPRDVLQPSRETADRVVLACASLSAQLVRPACSRTLCLREPSAASAHPHDDTLIISKQSNTAVAHCFKPEHHQSLHFFKATPTLQSSGFAPFANSSCNFTLISQRKSPFKTYLRRQKKGILFLYKFSFLE